LQESDAFWWLTLVRGYNVYTGASVDHVRMREMWGVMGPMEQDDLLALLSQDVE